MLLEQETTIQGILDWLQAEAEARHIPVTIYRDQAQVRQEQGYTFIGVPVRIEADTGAYDKAKLLTQLQNAWNDRKPCPDKRLFLVPGGVPQGAW